MRWWKKEKSQFELDKESLMDGMRYMSNYLPEQISPVEFSVRYKSPGYELFLEVQNGRWKAKQMAKCLNSPCYLNYHEWTGPSVYDVVEPVLKDLKIGTLA